MISGKGAIFVAGLAGLAWASPAPQVMDFAMIDAAPEVPNGPASDNAALTQTATLYTAISISGVATAPAAPTITSAIVKNNRRTPGTSSYTPYYAALVTGYTTDPALSATRTTTAGQACVTQPEAGTYCGFINPLDPCAPQPDGYGPVPTPDTVAAFQAYALLHSSAQAAPTNVPSINNMQYTQVFKDLSGSVSAQSYLGLFSLKTYDVPGCGAICDATNLCTSFNIFAERDPSLRPSTNDTAPTVWGNYCPNPPSMTTFKCTLWGSNIDSTMATNTGQFLEDFQVVIIGSDGYDRTNITTPPTCTAPAGSSSTSTPITTPTSTTTTTSSSKTTTTAAAAPTSAPYNPWTPPSTCKGKAIYSPKYLMGSQFFPGPFNPQVCSNYALLQNAANAKSKNGQQCAMFNAYYIHKNNIPYGTYCSLYTAILDSSWATVSSAKYGSDRYDCRQSWTYNLRSRY